MRKLAFRYRRVKEIYNTYKNNVGGESSFRCPFFKQQLHVGQKYQGSQSGAGLITHFSADLNPIRE